MKNNPPHLQTFISRFIKAPLAFFIFAMNSLVCSILLYPFALVKRILLLNFVKKACNRIMIQVAEFWIGVNNFNIRLTQNIQWDIQGLEGLSRNNSYLVTANHQSWVDIIILQKIFNKKIPFIRFFLKSELIFVPVLGWAWWALDFPFMKRYSRDYLKRHPEKRNDDFESIKKACAIFKNQNVSLLNFVEGTRLTPEKHQRQESPFENLLSPKAGGLAFVLNAMGSQFDSLLDVTIFYPQGPGSFWDFFKGEIPQIVVRVHRIEIPQEIISGDYLHDNSQRIKVQNWIREIWQRKDNEIKELKTLYFEYSGLRKK
jgi:1-acyl-sn-glycerol-3-phosphate acyltransferase